MKIDRELQRKILEILAESYSKSIALNKEIMALSEDVATLAFNLRYLAEHELITGGGLKARHVGDGSWQIEPAMMRITAQGIDFLMDDGGVSAALKTVTVKIHADTIRALIEEKIICSSIPEAEKQTLLSRLRSVPASALQNLATRFLEKGMEQIILKSPDALAWLQKSIPL